MSLAAFFWGNHPTSWMTGVSLKRPLKERSRRLFTTSSWMTMSNLWHPLLACCCCWNLCKYTEVQLLPDHSNSMLIKKLCWISSLMNTFVKIVKLFPYFGDCNSIFHLVWYKQNRLLWCRRRGKELGTQPFLLVLRQGHRTQKWILCLSRICIVFVDRQACVTDLDVMRCVWTVHYYCVNGSVAYSLRHSFLLRL